MFWRDLELKITCPQLLMLKCAKATSEFSDYFFFILLLRLPDIHHKATTGTNSFSPLQSSFKEKSSKGFLPGVNMRNKRPDNKEDFMEIHRYGHPSVRSATKWWAVIFRWHFVNRKLKNATSESIWGQELENLEDISGGGTHHQKAWSCLLERNDIFKE